MSALQCAVNRSYSLCSSYKLRVFSPLLTTVKAYITRPSFLSPESRLITKKCTDRVSKVFPSKDTRDVAVICFSLN